jgi:probable rRNA maturation factor
VSPRKVAKAPRARSNLVMTVDATVLDQVPGSARRLLAVEVRRMLIAAARSEARPGLDCSLRLTDDEAIRILNRDYRKKDKATDVLAFSQREGPSGHLHPEQLGDIVISVVTARRQAQRSLAHELRTLAAHGLCHLLGYDHRTVKEERVMNARVWSLLDEASRRGRIRAA